MMQSEEACERPPSGHRMLVNCSPTRFNTLGMVGRAILPAHVGRPLSHVLTLACYFDDSYEEQVHVVGGYLAPVEVWDDMFAPEWNDVLRAAPHRITEFKASDCRNGFGEFGPPWTKDERVQLTTDLVSVILKFPIMAGVSSAFVWPGALHPSQAKLSQRKHRVARSSYGVNVGMCLASAFQIVGILPDVKTVQPVFDRGKFFERVARNFGTVRKRLGPELSERVKFPIEERESLPALQAADLLAHETFKEVLNRFDGRKPSRALERLFAGRTPYLAHCLAMPPLNQYEQIRKRGRMPMPTPHVLFRSGMELRAKGNWGVP